MKKQKLTKWFPGHITPYHKGVYEVKSIVEGNTKYSKWTGKNWMFMRDTPERAATCTMGMRSTNQRKEWRGIAK